MRADAGGERGVIYDSAVALLQGLYPANTNYTTDLANGSVITGALSGYQVRIPSFLESPISDLSRSTFRVSAEPHVSSIELKLS